MSLKILSRKEKERVVRRLLIQAPPGEFLNAFDDLCLLVRDEKLMHYQGECAGHQHCQKYSVPLFIDGNPVLLSHHNVVGDYRFFDYQSKLSFRFNLLQNQLKDIQSHGIFRNETEYLRNVVLCALKLYVHEHYPQGNCNVLRKTVKSKEFLIACIENHNYGTDCWNGLWQSKWIFQIHPFLTQVTGRIFVQAHFFQYVNLHIVISKDLKESLEIVNQAQLAIHFSRLVEEQESKFQAAVSEELQELSNDVLRKILRRDLPVTRTLIDWQRILSDLNLVMYPELGYVIYSKSVLCNCII
ncbi:F-actin-capping protein subunit alpha-3 [Equus asinus]|uniref:F-actin-capping protein subunit alpha n=3 Tax=Equus TaxID=9789 RepID=A0A3Q2HB92_HORSE|nr:F-actin-capping protein subunit alpha-3 [Equus caballus]XP_008525958.1 PREDICTED: F-actin-capping protein subunit alpha-3 [Equus przewalskii]XP_014686836.1 F-actin-capping protein subunit alpha-3 [Equus asinus]XP_023498961.1 F-actin-capping protein subunit alpha-3 [Equus caballus]XP_023498968.1 F-actin-capping protein subunit alpha-3 [Equus caballus]XP_046511323.1 F-actin-capping protein subunit alpha-3 [Equus quagga]